MRKLLNFCVLALLISCDKVNKDPEPYIVIKIQKDLTDTTETKWYGVTLRNSAHKYYHFSTNKADENKINDTIMIGRNEMGDYFLQGENMGKFNIKDLRPVSQTEKK